MVAKVAGLCVVAAVALFAVVSSVQGSTSGPSSDHAVPAPAAVTLAVSSPSSGTVTSVDQVTVRGTVSPANAVVQIQGQPAAVGNGVFTGTATVHPGSTTIDVIASASGSTPGSTSIIIKRPSGANHGAARAASPDQAPAVPYNGGSAGGYSGQNACAPGLAVGPDTSCAFAENVRSAYESDGQGIVSAYSPVTNRTYEMDCSSSDPVVCTGGDKASVYISGDYATATREYVNPHYDYTPPAVTHSGYWGEKSCGGDLAVGPNTTCAFAENVRAAYESDGAGTVMAYSPVTKRTYAMSCSSDNPVLCTGANNASVYF
jgi:Glucodextranase, domain B